MLRKSARMLLLTGRTTRSGLGFALAAFTTMSLACFRFATVIKVHVRIQIAVYGDRYSL